MTRPATRSLPRLTRLMLVSACILLGGGPAHGQQTRIYIANDDHTDYMWTADEPTYERVFQEMLDYYLDLADTTDKNPPPYQSRFNCDGSYWLWVYEKNRPLADFERLVGRIKSGHISAPLNALVSCYGGQPAEAVLRGMYYPGHLERKYGLRFTQAIAMENQTLPLGLVSLWAGAGAKYSWKGVCGCASKLTLGVRKHEIYWWAGPDGQRVLMKWYTKPDIYSRPIGGYAEAFDPLRAIRTLDADATFLSRYHPPGSEEPYLVRGAFGFGWDALDRKTGVPYPPDPKTCPQVDHFHVIALRQTTPGRQIIVSNQEDFFRDFAATHGAQLPTERVTFGNEWDLYSASMAETTARVRRAVEKLRPAEALATLVSLRRPDFLRGREAARDRAFIDLGLYWEHDWTADGPISREARAAWQNKLADEIERYVHTLHDDAAAQLGGLIPADEQAVRFYVFNPLGWPRTAAADFRYDGSPDIHVRDLAAGADVPHQLETRGGQTWLRILASGVPAVGYQVFEIRRGPGAVPTDAAATVADGNHAFENARVKLVIEDDGAIRSFIDKDHPDQDLAAQIDGLSLNDLSANDTGRSRLTVVQCGPVSATLESTGDSARNHVTRITLLRGSDRVEIRNEITENFGDVRHWTFSFNLAAPDVHTEEVGAVIRVKRKADGGDYADENARCDYATLNHFADISDGANTRGVTLANADCSFVQLGRSTPAAFDHTTAQLKVLIGGQVDGDKLGIRNQNGENHFLQRFALRPHGVYDPVAAMKFALEHQNPLVVAPVLGNETSSYPASTYSLLTVSNPGVLLWALKPAEEGIDAGIIARVWNLAPTPADYTISFAPGLSSARRATHIETDLGTLPVADGQVSSPIAALQLQTLRLLSPPGRTR